MTRCTTWMLVLVLMASLGTAFGAGRGETGPDRPAVFGMVAYTDPAAQYAQIEPLAAWLAQRSGLQVRLKMYTDYFSLLNDIDHESLDVALVSPLVYSFCMDDPALTYLATVLVGGKPFNHCAILARRDGTLRSCKDLAGKRIAFADPYSATGYVCPAAFLLEQGLVKDGKALYTPVFCGSHAKALRALQEGKADAAATYDSYFAFASHQAGDRDNPSLGDFRILKLLPDRVPSSAMVCRSALGKQVIGDLAEALQQYERERAVPGSPLQAVFYSGFHPGHRDAYLAFKKYLDALLGAGVPAPAAPVDQPTER